MKYLYAFILFTPLFCISQNYLEKQLDSITTLEDAITFLNVNKPEDGKLNTYNKEKHKTKLAIELFQLSVGGKKIYKTQFKKTYYKVIDKTKVDFCKFNIIVLDGNNTSQYATKIIRNKVLSQYNGGHKFKDLVKLHSSGSTVNTEGNTGWVKLGEISDTFDEEAFNKNRTINEVFTIDDLEHKKYYIVVKTQNKKPIEEITVLKFTVDI